MKKRRILPVAIIIVCSILLYCFIEPYWLRIRNVTIQDVDIPHSFNNLRIVFVSDIHHGPYFSKKRVVKLVNRINALSPDIILLGGDYVHKDFAYIETCFDELGNLKASIGKYGVLGNHDHWEGASLTKNNMNKAGIEIMDNKSVWVYRGSDRIKIGGVGDLDCDMQDINPTVGDVKEDDFVILMSHNPDYAEKIHTGRLIFLHCCTY